MFETLGNGSSKNESPTFHRDTIPAIRGALLLEICIFRGLNIVWYRQSMNASSLQQPRSCQMTNFRAEVVDAAIVLKYFGANGANSVR